MNDIVVADFIVEREADEEERRLELSGWEDVVFELEDEREWPWS